MQAANAKKPCTTTSKATKPKSSPLKDPQNVAAKNVCTSVSQNRRERISERLKTLQELVPNGSKFAGPLAFENEEYNGSLPNLKLKRQRLSTG
ncbi:putative transcription factor bHLH086 isoform X2 [Phaseolus vulgaris]|uniref:putative transcription factor bHLH086 isoform X2 n=1 Tax=Phaseolus vulgaris TaxID=3885 RepID=UPI0035CA23E9